MTVAGADLAGKAIRARSSVRPRLLEALFLALAVGHGLVVLIAVREIRLFERLDPSLPGFPATGADTAGIALRIGLALGWLATLALARGWVRSARGPLDLLAGVPTAPTPTGALLAPVRAEGLAPSIAPTPDSRRVARRARRFFLAALGLFAIGLVLTRLAPDRMAGQVALGILVAAHVAAAAVAASGVSLVRTIDRGWAIAIWNVQQPARPRLPFAIPATAMAIAVLVGIGGVAGGATAPPAVGCRPVGFACLQLVVRADRDDPNSSAEFTVTAAVARSAARNAPLLVYLVGGPGVSGLADAEAILARLPWQVTSRFDVLVLDPRGVGRSGAADCPVAAATYDRAAPDDPGPARAFVEACLAETGVAAADVDRYRTDAVVADLDAIRAHLGHERIAIYGESYGTEVAQAYAIAHPDRVSHLILDAPVDPGATPREFWTAAAHGFDAVLTQTLDACRASADCRFDLPAPDAALGRLLARFDGATVAANYVDASGELTTVELDRVMVDTAMSSLMYGPTGRMLVLRAIAAAETGDLGSLARLVVEHGTTASTRARSTFGYYAVTCGDARTHPDPGAGAEAILADAEAARIADLRLGLVYWVELACAFWPEPPAEATRPVLQGPTSFPVLVLGATGDPITPAAGARRIADRLPDAALVETIGGPHVTFGRGDECVDDVVIALLAEDHLPEARVTSCDGIVTIAYQWLTETSSSAYGDALDVLVGADIEIYAAPEYLLWDRETPLTFGCRIAGRITVRATEADDDELELDGCTWAAGYGLDGTGRVDAEGNVELEVVTRRGAVTYTFRSDSGVSTVRGTWDGRPIDLRS